MQCELKNNDNVLYFVLEMRRKSRAGSKKFKVFNNFQNNINILLANIMEIEATLAQNSCEGNDVLSVS